MQLNPFFAIPPHIIKLVSIRYFTISTPFLWIESRSTFASITKTGMEGAVLFALVVCACFAAVAWADDYCW
jgi:hypothetical protein